ncbi:ABC transporter substrate-binding protein [Oscillatoriales cyanobacterium LEGE 11467]|uniref:ABC transporter substrate-binding protein n=1 Tax=Zarconia navalis LEGE 11467 TaxID=1828826 RepID=A0A928VY42_9CYAN|nr:ABC transporter substrate-binding protein [Zarconia navalis]MBE9040273.1 ABC transporter substrate-binding protein [Zarconia navalis LEGE 11467]
MIKFLKNGLILCVVLILVSCTNSQLSTNTSEVNSAENSAETVTEAVVDRVVALSSLTADITQQLAASKLVGIPGSDVLKEDPRFAELPTVSSGRTPPNLEAIVALEPELVLGAAGFHDAITQRLDEIGIATQLVKVDSWETLTQITEDLADRLSADAEPLLERYQACLAKAPIQGKSTLVLVSRQPILAPNKTSWAGDFLQEFNTPNLAAELQGESPIGGYVTLSAEKVLQENPDTILIVDPGNEGILEQFQKDVFWKQLQASQNDRIYTVDYYGLINPGSIGKIEEACNKLGEIMENSGS